MRLDRRLVLLLLLGGLVLGAPVAAQAPAQVPAPELPAVILVRVTTDLGAIDLELDAANAPRTVANFLRYVDGGHYAGGQFHRSARLETQAARAVKIEVIQASVNKGREAERFPPIALERTSVTGLRHVDGAVSMARGGADTATSSFFICVGDQPSLDFGGARNPDGQGFAAFGRVVAGLDVVRRIHRAPAEEEVLTPPVRIVDVVRVPPAK